MGGPRKKGTKDNELQQLQNGEDNSGQAKKDEVKLITDCQQSLACMDSLLPAAWSLWWLPIALTFLCYAPNLIIYASDGETWVYDDHSSVRSNPCVVGEDQTGKPVPWTCVFWADYWGTPMSSNSSHKSYRPVTTVFFIAERLLWGFWDSRLWHLGNVATKAAAVWLFSKVSKICLTCPESAQFATLLFAVHPIHTESVSNITGQAESLSAVFMLLAFLAYSRRRGSVLVNYTAAIVATVAATLSKEAGFAALAIICAHIVSLELRAVKAATVKKDQPPSNAGRLLNWQDLKLIRSSMWLRLAVFFISGAAIFIGRCYIQQEKPQFNSFMNPAGFHSSRLARTLTMLYYALIHSRLLVAPATLCPDYSNSAIPEVEGLLDQRCLPMYLALAGLCWCVYTLVKAALDKRRDVHEMVTCTSWLVLPFLPVSNLFFVVGFAVAERVLFAPSIGFCLLVGLGVQKLTEAIIRLAADQTKHRIISHLHRSLRCLLVILAVRTCLRDLDWNTSRSLWFSAYKACPPNANVLSNLAFSDPQNPGFQRFLLDRATAVGKPFSWDHSVDALARMYDEAGQHKEMLDLCKKHNHLGSPRITQCMAFAYLHLRKPAKAVIEFQRLYGRVGEPHWHLSRVKSSDVFRGYARSLALAGKLDDAMRIIRQHESEVPEPMKQHLAVSEVLAAALRPAGQQNASQLSFESTLNRFISQTPSPDAFLDLAKELCQASRYGEALTVLDSVQPVQARQSPMAIYLRKLAQNGQYSETAMFRKRESELLKNLTGLSPLSTLSVLVGIAERAAENDLGDSNCSLLHACSLIVQPLDALLSRLDDVAKAYPPLSALTSLRQLFLNGQRGELYLHSKLMSDRKKLETFLMDIRQAERELSARAASGIDEGWGSWRLATAAAFQLNEECD